jgi:Phage tail tube protein
MADKIDSNVTGLRFAEESSLGVLPGSPVWYALEPNSYSDFGGQIATIARNPINPSRQRKKGVTTDLDASGGFNQDLTFDNTTRLMQGFFFADIREKKTTAPLNSAAIPVTGVTAADDTFAAASGLTGFLAKHLVFASGFTNTANNGLHVVQSASTATALVVADGLVDEASPPAAAKLQVVGYEFASATLNVVMNGDLVRLTRASGTVDFTTLGLIPGEWIFVGGDAVGNQFTNNQGFARVKAVAATYIELDKTGWEPVAETGTGKLIRIFFGDVLKNESTTNLIKRRTYQVERTLGEDDNGTMSEYLIGAVCNELTINVAQADKVTLDMSFIATDNQQRDGTTGVKAGDRPSLSAGSAFNTSSDFTRIKLALADPDDASPTALFAFATEMNISVNNNASPNKAIGVLGAFDVSVGTFEVGGSMTAYFANIAAVQAVRDNEDITLDLAMVKENKGILFDVPLLSLGDGRLAVEQDQAITLPLETMAAESSFGHTLYFGSFSYLPDLAG